MDMNVQGYTNIVSLIKILNPNGEANRYSRWMRMRKKGSSRTWFGFFKNCAGLSRCLPVVLPDSLAQL
jgi:hypothetical protein